MDSSTSTNATKPTVSASRGALITVEGLDRAGKSTQCNLLVERLEATGVKVRLQKFPDRTTPIGKMIDTYLRATDVAALEDHVIHLLFSANRWELSEQIKSDLLSGTTVILDRYIYSGVTFSAAKGLPYDWCLTPDLGLPRPDVVLFLNISEEDSSQRAGFGEERYEKKEIQDKVRRLFERMYKDRNGHKEDWELVDAGRTLEEVSEDMWRVVKRVVEKTKVGGGEVGVTY